MNMEPRGAVPHGYLTVGQAAEKMGVTVRTLQYYHKKGLLCPSAETEGGRRLYTAKDLVKLHQILSLKQLGFSLDDIKNRLIPLESPADMARVLTEQEEGLRAKIQALRETLRQTEALKAEVLQMRQVDFKKYADIIVNLQMNNEYYWMIKHFDGETLDKIRENFDKDSGSAMVKTINRLRDTAARLQKNNVPPESPQGQQFAKEFWDMIMKFTRGDLSVLPNLMKLGSVSLPRDEEKQPLANSYTEAALSAYFDQLGYDPLQEAAP